MQTLVLADNGSKRPESTIALRGLAAALAQRLGRNVHPVSLQHSDGIPPERLGGRAADTLETLLRREIPTGSRRFLVLPLFFGPSRALTRFIPDSVAALRAELGSFEISVAPELCPLPAGEPRLAGILADQVQAAAAGAGTEPSRVLLVDHGSPIPEVTAVRGWLAGRLAERLGPSVRLREAVMERRAGPDYDFNGPLLEDALRGLAAEDRRTPIFLSLMFLAAGRHAGPGGDIERIATNAEREHPGLRVVPSPLVGAHPALAEILADRVASDGFP